MAQVFFHSLRRRQSCETRLQNRRDLGWLVGPLDGTSKPGKGRDPTKDSRLPGGDSAQPRERVLTEAGAWGE